MANKYEEARDALYDAIVVELENLKKFEGHIMADNIEALARAYRQVRGE